jgi:protein-disulfide isomerase
VAQIAKQYGDQIRVVYKANPLPFHDKAMPAALAAFAAAKQGKFWEYSEKLFEKQKELGAPLYESIAAELSLDVARFQQDQSDPAIKSRIEWDQGAAAALGASGTPAFFINGRSLSGARPVEDFQKIIDEELGKAKALKEQGVAPAEISTRLVRMNEGTEKYVAYWIEGRQPPKPPDSKKQAEKKAPPEDTKTVWRVTVRPDDPVEGPASAPVTIVEFSDFQCPFCSKVLPTIEEVQKAYGDKVRVLFKQNPLSFHDKARLAAKAALAAHQQGKFWEMHDLLFANQKALERTDLEKYAGQLGLDLDKFRAALDSPELEQRIVEDQELGGEVGAEGTPNLFINGRKFTGAKAFADLKPAIEEELAKAKALTDAGTPLAQVYDKLVGHGKRKQALDAKVRALPIAGSPTLGPDTASVTIVEFSDFECPFCSRVGGPLKQVVHHYQGQVKLVFKNFPLNIHKSAQLAAEAAMAAGEQGRFWEMHDALFQNQKALSREDIEAFAEGLGLDMARFKAALDGKTFRDEVAADMKLGNQVGVRGTPTVFINGRLFNPPGGWTAEAVIKVIDKEFLGK